MLTNHIDKMPIKPEDIFKQIKIDKLFKTPTGKAFNIDSKEGELNENLNS